MRRLILALALLASSPALAQTKFTQLKGTCSTGQGCLGLDASAASGFPAFAAGVVTFYTPSLGTSGSDLNWSTGLALNVPDAGASARGVVTTGTQSFAGEKTFSARTAFGDGLKLSACSSANEVIQGVGICAGIGSTTQLRYRIEGNPGMGGPFYGISFVHTGISADRSYAWPNVDGTVITSANVSDIPAGSIAESQIASADETGTGGKLVTGTGSYTSGNLLQANDVGDAIDSGVPVTSVAVRAHPPAGRLTLSTGVPITFSDVTAATQVFYTPYTGTVIPLYYSGSWRAYTFSEQSIKVTDTQTCTTTSGSTSVTGCSDTSQLVRGMVVASSNVTGGQTISAITSSTAFTLSGNANGTGSASTTFKIPASTLVDVVAVPTSTTAFRLQFLTLWSDSGAGTSSRALAVTYANAQDGVLTNDTAYAAGDSNTIGAKGGRYLGTLRTTSTAGQTEDSESKRLLWNMYNRAKRKLVRFEASAAASWTWATPQTWHQANASSSNQLDIVHGIQGESDLSVTLIVMGSNSTGGNQVGCAIGLSSTTAPVGGSIVAMQPVATGAFAMLTASYSSSAGGAGYQYVSWLEGSVSAGAGTQTYYGTDTSVMTAARRSGLVGWINQ